MARRIGQALDARANLKSVDAAALGERLARVRAAAGEGVGGPGEAGSAVVVELGGSHDDDVARTRRRSRLVLAAVASAAAAAVILAAAVSVAHQGGSALAPAAPAQPSPSSSSSLSSAEGTPGWWSGFSELDHEQWPSDREGISALGQEIVPDSVRMLVQLGEVKYWAGFSAGGVLCSRVVGPGVDQGVCTVDPATGTFSMTAPVEVSDGSVAPQVWLVPLAAPAAQTDPLTAQGLIEWIPGVWVEASALKPPLGQYARFRDAPTAADEVPPSSAIVVRDPIVPGAMRLLYDGKEGTFYAAYLALGKVCVFWNAPSGGSSASMCMTPQRLAGEGFGGVSEDDNSYGTAWVVPDDLDTSGWPALGRVQLAKNLWLKTEALPERTAAPIPVEPTATVGEPPAPTFIPDLAGTPVPSVVGVTQTEAAEMLRMHGIAVGQVIVQDAGSAPSGMVVKMAPASGTQVPDGGVVDLFVAK
ncbi:PASTA domain-containing protein [Quadrisphaera granulorum]|uniref:PASTA domain-containing protein n=1 Tax=Quadrisphaera granulorum TaxID=317664 RepID=UPI0014727CB8|nr:PASTA domain-containing protein [Quadrisphaera granulorum]